LGLTTVMVTHDQEEALTMADRLVLMAAGEVRQVGTQRDLYERPADRFVAGFVGRSTFLAGRIDVPGRFVTEGGLPIACPTSVPAGRALLVLRPERLVLGSSAEGFANAFEGSVEFVSYLGGLIDVHVRLSPADRVVVQLASRADGAMPAIGDRIMVGWSRDAALVFADAAGAEIAMP
jgi:putative spermidine/putrescine transport system ATP-binding protein